jgi:hypothetical protein
MLSQMMTLISLAVLFLFLRYLLSHFQYLLWNLQLNYSMENLKVNLRDNGYVSCIFHSQWFIELF